MSAGKHTPGRLFVVPGSTNGGPLAPYEIVLDDVDGGNPARDYFLVSVIHGDPGVLEANARRIAACWNACQGIPIEVLETHSAGGLPWSVADRIEELVLRDELVRELEAAIDREYDSCLAPDQQSGRYGRLKALIAKASGVHGG